MPMNAKERQSVKEELLQAVYQNMGIIDVPAIAERLSLTKQTIYRLLRSLVAEGVLGKEKEGRENRYFFQTEQRTARTYQTKNLSEDTVLKKDIFPHLSDLSEQAKRVFSYVFTEMLNNAIEHAESPEVMVSLSDATYFLRCRITDHGIGIFQKIQQSMGLEELRFAILELAKGKFTTDPASHTGEGIFFSSKVADRLFILSDGLFFSGGNGEPSALFEDSDISHGGTTVIFEIAKNCGTDIQEVFQRYTQYPDDYGFSKTIVPVRLLEYREANPIFVSRSQAKRLLVRFDRFENIVLDFAEVEEIGQGFADEIFRVFPQQHPNSRIDYVHASPKVERMIRHVQKVP